MRTEVKIGIGFCFVLVLVVVAYLAYHGGSARPGATSDTAEQASRTTPSTPRPGTLPPRPASPVTQAPAPAAPRPAAAPGSPISPLLPAGVQVASAPASQPTSREAVMASGGPLPSMSPLAGGAPTPMTGVPISGTPMASTGAPRPMTLTPMEPVTGNSVPSPVTVRTAGSTVGADALRPLTVSGSTTGPQPYTVAPGDTLWKIASRTYGNGSQTELIKKANPGLNPDRLQVGQKIILPAAPGSTGGAAVSTVSVVARPDTTTGMRPSAPGQAPYTIKPGDNPSAIAAREYGDERLSSAIMKANPGLVATSMKVGQTIVLPSKAQAQSMAGVSASSSGTSAISSPAISRSTVQPAAFSTTANRSTPAVSATPAVSRRPAYVEGKPYFGDR